MHLCPLYWTPFLKVREKPSEKVRAELSLELLWTQGWLLVHAPCDQHYSAKKQSWAAKVIVLVGLWAEVFLDKEKQLPTSAPESKKQPEEWTFQPD